MGFWDAVASAGPLCKQSAPRSMQKTTPTVQHLISQFYRPDALPDAQPTNVKALKAPKLPGTGEFAIVELRASSVCCMCQRRNTATTRKRLYKQSQNQQIARSRTKVWYLDFAPALPLLSAALRVRTVFCYTLWKSQSD